MDHSKHLDDATRQSLATIGRTLAVMSRRTHVGLTRLLQEVKYYADAEELRGYTDPDFRGDDPNRAERLLREQGCTCGERGVCAFCRFTKEER